MPSESERERERGRRRTVAQGVDDAHALLRVERQAALEEVDRERVGVRVERLERLLLLERERAQVVAAALRADGVKVVERRRAEDAEDERELVVVCGTKCTSGRVVRQEKKGEKRTVATREERFAVEHLGEDAADGPCERQQSQRFNRLREVRGRADAQTSMANVYSLNLREGDEESAMEGEDARRDDAREHDLGRAVPPRSDVSVSAVEVRKGSAVLNVREKDALGHEADRLRLARHGGPCQAARAQHQYEIDLSERERWTHPKSQILRSQLALRRRLDGLRSRWRTLRGCGASAILDKLTFAARREKHARGRVQRLEAAEGLAASAGRGGERELEEDEESARRTRGSTGSCGRKAGSASRRTRSERGREGTHWSSDSSWLRITRCRSVSMSSCGRAKRVSGRSRLRRWRRDAPG